MVPGPTTSASASPGNLIEMPHSWAPLQTYSVSNSRGRAKQSVFSSPPDDSDACQSLRNPVIEKQEYMSAMILEQGCF